MKDAKFIDVPAKKPWLKRWFVRSAKLALVVGVVGSSYEAWTRFSDYEARRVSMARMETSYRCAASLSDESLSSRPTNGYTIDISSLGCTAEPFFVSMQEISDVRSGATKFEPYGNPFDLKASTIAFIVFFITVLLATSACILVVATALWIWK